MASNDTTRIVLGVFAAAGVVLLSYLFLKKYGGKKKSDTYPDKVGDGLETKKEEGDESGKTQEKDKHEEEVSELKPKEPTGQSTETDSAANQTNTDDAPTGPDSQDYHSSFYVVDGGEVPLDNGNHAASARKSDRSSDESSYDVIEDVGMDEVCDEERKDIRSQDDPSKLVATGEGGVKDKKVGDASVIVIDDSINEPDVVVINDSITEPGGTNVEDLDKSGISSSSHYTSADESVDTLYGSLIGDPGYKGVKEEMNLGKEDQDASLNDDEKTMIPSGAASENGTDGESHSGGSGKTADGLSVDDKGGAMSTSLSSWQDVTEDNRDEADIGDQKEETEGGDTTQNAQVSPDVSPHVQEPVDEPTSEEVKKVLLLCQNSPQRASRRDLDVLMAVLSKPDTGLVSTVLNCLLRVSAFTQHNVDLRESGCCQVVTFLTMEKCKDLTQDRPDSEEMLHSLLQVTSNFTLDPKTQVLMEICIPSLIEVFCKDSTSEHLQLSLLRPLINFSAEATYHSYFTGMVNWLYSILDSGSQGLRVQVLKFLVNLSLNRNMVPHLLAAKAPTCLSGLLEPPTPDDIILRAVTFLANVEQGLQDDPKAALALPVEDKAESPLTLHTALKGVSNVPDLRNKVYRLTKNDDDKDIVFQASRLYKLITAASK